MQRKNNLPGARTRASVDRSTLNRLPTHSNATGMPAYLSCKYNPFETNKTEKGYIPDGRGKNVLLRDYKTSYDIIATKPFAARISPTYPCPVRFYQPDATDTSLVINGISPKGDCLHTSPTLGSGTDGVWWSAGALVDSISGAKEVDTKHAVSSGRCVSTGYRLVYTGEAAKANGLVVVDTIPEKIDAYMSSNFKTINYLDNTGAQSNIVAGFTDQAGAPIITVDTISGKQAFSIQPADQYVGRPENGVHGVLKSRVRGNNHEFKPWWECGVVPVSDSVYDPAIALGASPALNSLAAGKALGLNFWDDQLESVHIKVSGTGDYRLEIVSCFEFEYPPNSVIIDLTVSSPKPNDAVLRMDDTLAPISFAKPFSVPLLPQPRRANPRITIVNPINKPVKRKTTATKRK